MEYTVQCLSDIMNPAGTWATAEKNAGTILKTRFGEVEATLSTTLDNRWDAKLAEIKDEILGTTSSASEFAYGQYLKGMSAAFGGGHTNIGIFAKVTSEERRIAAIDATTKYMQSINSLSYQSTSAMPLVVPIESQLVADASASAVEAYAMGEIRNQQVRQSEAAGNLLATLGPNMGNAATPYEETLAFASVNATGLAAKTK
jgi:hypothetical protein